MRGGLDLPTSVSLIEDWLRSNRVLADRLSVGQLRDYTKRDFEVGWRIPIGFSDRVRRLDILLRTDFPRSPPRVALVDRPDFLTWPHLHRDGVLCILPDAAEVDIAAPAMVVANVLGEAVHLIEELSAGMREDDFRQEFQTYWQWLTLRKGGDVFSLLEAAPPSRLVSFWRGTSLAVVAESDELVVAWLRRRFPKIRDSELRPHRSLLLWLDRPPVPKEYPRTPDTLRQLLRQTQNGEALFAQLMPETPNGVVILFAAPTQSSAAFAAVSLSQPSGQSQRAYHLTRGFRPGRVPPQLLEKRYMSGRIAVMNVERADPSWIHGRGRDDRFAIVQNKRVAIIGCGSLGSSVAVSLAAAGVGHLLLVDDDRLEWANIGRHALGAPEVGKNKAESLAAQLTKRFPHASFDSRTDALQTLTNRCPSELASYDLIVSATGSWEAEGALNHWHRKGTGYPSVLYGWTEPHGCAGHAVAITSTGGCLQCGFSTAGIPDVRVTDWPESEMAYQEPGCGAVFQPYGPTDVAHTIALISECAIDCIVGRVTESTHRIWVGRRAAVESSGGRWSEGWLQLSERPEGEYIHSRRWTPNASCWECGTEAA